MNLNNGFPNSNNTSTTQGTAGANATMAHYTAKTFGWMFAGLMVTFLVSVTTLYSGLLPFVLSNMIVFVVIFIAELVMVSVLGRKLHTLSVGAARGLFFGYAALNGLTFSVIFVAYASSQVVFAFLLTSLYFGALALYGYYTQTDLTKLRPILVGGVIFLFISNILLIFFDFAAFDRLVCLVGIATFLALTAFDTQKIKSNYTMFQQDRAMLQKASIYSALQLYLDFINLFLYLLRFMGRKNN